jgi:diguanylate cyclase (GGDEF)-like protein/PAS domain S-box-containing protein
VLEASARFASPVSAPEAVLFLAVMYVSFRAGALSGLLGALVADLYLCYSFVSPYHPELSSGDTLWRLAAALILLPGSATLIGRLRDRFELLLQREREARAAAEIERERTVRILENMTDGFVAIDRGWHFTQLNAPAERLLRQPRDQLVGKDSRALLSDHDAGPFFEHYRQALETGQPAVFEAHSELGDGWYQVHVYPSPEGLSIFFRDITERRKHEDALHSISLKDELTGLYNRRGFLTLAEQQCRISERSLRYFILVFMDLDGLKQINDSLGHGAGDLAIREAAAVLRSTFRESDIVARIGGDEFAALMLDTHPSGADILIDRMNLALAERNAELPFRVSLSCGMAGFDPDAPCSVDDLLRQADHEMYQRKREKQRSSADS